MLCERGLTAIADDRNMLHGANRPGGLGGEFRPAVMAHGAKEEP